MTPEPSGTVADTRALLLDYGGVLTLPVHDSFATFERALGVPPGGSFSLLRAASESDDGGMIGALERGEIDVEEFDAHLHRLLADAGYEVAEGTGLLEGLFAAMEPAGDLWTLADEVRAQGVRTGLLSNSWGMSAYPVEQLERSFDTLVISGEVGLRKPDPRIYELAAQRVGAAVERCVFVDDLRGNVAAAVAVGMHGIHHTGDEAATRAAALAALDLDAADGGHDARDGAAG